MKKAKKGDKVQVHYTGTLDDGTTFDSSREREPLEFTLGEEMVVPGFEKGVEGLEVGEIKTIHIEPKEAYGDIREDLFMEIEKKQLPPEITPEIGMKLQAPMKNGQIALLTIIEINEDKLKLDANHDLAGKALNFDIELIGIVE
jgi:FKBP-type peptidyl-prolyl cis-trans isomerase 2